MCQEEECETEAADCATLSIASIWVSQNKEAGGVYGVYGFYVYLSLPFTASLFFFTTLGRTGRMGLFLVRQGTHGSVPLSSFTS